MDDLAPEKVNRTVFVRSLPYNCTDAILQTTFEEIGPVKSAYIIAGKNGESRGFGFVEFALEEDAGKCVHALD